MAAERPYHHGDLERALKAAAVDLISEVGPAGFSLREVARRAGVSHAAPAHHFGDSRGLLTAMAVDGFRVLTTEVATVRASTPDPRRQFEAMAMAYVRVGLEHPAHAAILFREDLVDCENPEYQHWGLTAYGELEAVIAALRATLNPTLDVENASRLAWACMQGLLVLEPNFRRMARVQSQAISDPLTLAATFARLLLDGFTAG